MAKTSQRGMAPPVFSTVDAKLKPRKRGSGPNVPATTTEASDLNNAGLEDAPAGPTSLVSTLSPEMGVSALNMDGATDKQEVHTLVPDNAAAEPTSTNIVEPSKKETESDSSTSSCEASVQTDRDTEDAAEAKIPEEENDSISTIILHAPEENTDSGDSSASGCEDAAEEEDKTRVFVTVLTARVLSKCTVVKLWKKESLVTYTQQLVDQTLQGLTVSQAFCVDNKDIKQMCKAVINDLKKTYGNMRKLETAIFAEHPSVDAAIVQCLQAHIKKHSAAAAHKQKKSGGWRQHIWPLLHVAGICALWGILFVILA